mgnify:CR=1 FL=1
MAYEHIANKLHETGDVLYPLSMEGVWQCDRVIKSIDGDTFQAKEAYRALGGTDSSFVTNTIESYHTKYIPSPQQPGSEEDKTTIVEYVVNDRGYELASRLHTIADTVAATSTVNWTVEEPNTVEYTKTNNRNSKNTIQLRVTDRTVEQPSEQGFGFNELMSIQDSSGSGNALASTGTLRAVQIKRRYRRSFEATTGARIVEGLEIMKTYRVLDGIAGIEYPTSTVKSQITLSRPN